MADLLAGIDDSFFNAVPTPDPTPKKKPLEASRVTAGTSVPQPKLAPENRNAPSVPETHANDDDFDQLLAGAEDWDWNDMNDDFLSPKKVSPKKKSPAVCVNISACKR